MPHVVLTNVSYFESFYNNFKKKVIIVKNDKEEQKKSIIRFDEILLNQSKNIILIKTISIENDNQSQTYYIMVMKKNNDQITIRLDPLTDPKNKTDLVKTSIANIAKQYKENDKTISIIKTNLELFLT
ncbi:MAG: hypothetical protein ACPKPY_01115 [Nitrososphaeraceae archaeon]